MDLAALQQGHLIGPAPRSISCARWGSVFGLARQEFRQDAFRWFVAESPKGPVCLERFASVRAKTGRLIGEQLGRAFEHREQALLNRSQQPGGAADPVGQGRAIEIDVLPRI